VQGAFLTYKTLSGDNHGGTAKFAKPTRSARAAQGCAAGGKGTGFLRTNQSNPFIVSLTSTSGTIAIMRVVGTFILIRFSIRVA
jgi:hypothetical protein